MRSPARATAQSHQPHALVPLLSQRARRRVPPSASPSSLVCRRRSWPRRRPRPARRRTPRAVPARAFRRPQITPASVRGSSVQRSSVQGSSVQGSSVRRSSGWLCAPHPYAHPTRRLPRTTPGTSLSLSPTPTPCRPALCRVPPPAPRAPSVLSARACYELAEPPPIAKSTERTPKSTRSSPGAAPRRPPGPVFEMRRDAEVS